jgi:hypothetical protein
VHHEWRDEWRIDGVDLRDVPYPRGIWTWRYRDVDPRARKRTVSGRQDRRGAHAGLRRRMVVGGVVEPVQWKSITKCPRTVGAAGGVTHGGDAP